MKPRFVGLLVAVLACTASEIGAQTGSLTAFSSERELTRYLRSLEPPSMPPECTTPPTPAPLPPPTSADSAGGAFVVTGRVTEFVGTPVSGVQIRVDSLDVAASTGADGRYRLVIPAARARLGAALMLRASRRGWTSSVRAISPRPAEPRSVDFYLANCLSYLDLSIPHYPAPPEHVNRVNNQHTEVQEGDVVKLHGDHLVILQRQQLFTVNVGGGRLELVDAVHASGRDADAGGMRYDEMLVSGDNVVVIGYHQQGGGVEAVLFHVSRNGRLRHRSTYQVGWAPEYPARYYAARIINGTLVLYAPMHVGTAMEMASWMPVVSRRDAGAMNGGEPVRMYHPARIYRPGRPLGDDEVLSLHTVTTCTLDAGEFNCRSRAVLAPFGRAFYLSPTAVYVWVTDWDCSVGPERGAYMVYRVPLDGSPPTALGVDGTPADEFSFLESGDGYLNVLVRSEWPRSRLSDEWGRDAVRLLRVPLERFGNGRSSAQRHAYRALPRFEVGWKDFTNRFAGPYLLYGEEANGRESPPVLNVVRWRDGRRVQLALSHDVDAIGVTGRDAVVMGLDSANLYLTAIRLGDEPHVAQRFVLPITWPVFEPFVYRSDRRNEGVLALSLQGPEPPGLEHVIDSSAHIVFLRYSVAQLHPMGVLEPRLDDLEDDGCVGCADWYGNARPLFVGRRTFALLGYELVEGVMEDGRLREVRRVTFAPRAAQASR